MPATDSVTEADFDWFSPEACRDPQQYDAARVARLEGVSLLSALARHVASIELAGEPRITTNMAVHGHEALPLRIVPA